ncbi:MAG: PLP-dependent aminotransferase family protein [Bryobacterales bacterium]|nr:PLP-dependent aminotransferase family protein [Bryobacterales bacterium]
MSSPDLILPARPQGVTITQWIYEGLRQAILSGRLRRGSPIPTTRSLAQQYSVSRRIVVNAFDQLRDEGYLEARIGAGTRVSENVPEDYLAPTSKPVPSTRLLAPEDAFYRRPVRPFRPMEPALDEFPTELWARLEAKTARRAGTALLAGGDASGYFPLREAIAGHLASVRGVSCTAHEIVITSGTQQSLDLVARLLLRPRDEVWMEDPGYLDAIEAFRSAGASVHPVRVDEHGLNPALGRIASPKPRAVYVTPAHQFPLAVTLSLARRLDLLRWTRQRHIAVIEDDYDSEFRFSGRPVAAMKGLTGSQHVFLLGTFSKTVFPALRLGYIVVPPQHMDSLLRLRRQTDRYPPGLSQAVLAAFLNEGHFARHLRRMRELYGTRLHTLRHEAGRRLSGLLRFPEIEAGLNTPAFLENGMTSRQAAERAAARGVEAWPLARYAIVRRDLRGLILGFAACNERAIREGVIALARALA